jgi:tetratricopeptide repeat protein
LYAALLRVRRVRSRFSWKDASLTVPGSGPLISHARTCSRSRESRLSRAAVQFADAGNPAAARDLTARLLPVLERVLGAEHPHTLTTRHQLAYWTGLAGDPAAARDLFAELLPARDQVLGPQHPDALITRATPADWTGQAGDPAAARDLFAGVLSARERVLGADHPRTLAVRASLAGWTGRATRSRRGTSTPR